VGIDLRSMVITEGDKASERELRLGDRLSSTLCGVGSAVSRRVLRGEDVRLAQDVVAENPWLEPFLTDVASEVHEAIREDKKVLIEGTQGFGLSLYHSPHYPRVTSRDTSAAGFISEVGISPLTVSQIVVVFRTFPVRVSGRQAGILNDEITWELLQEESGYPYPIHEITSVTHKTRRIGRFDWDLARRATDYNQPTMLAVNGLDYLNFSNLGVRRESELDDRARAFLERLEAHTRTPIGFLGTGPTLRDQASLVASNFAPYIHRTKLGRY
jgi:adenylosuccinate synthase